VDNRFDSTYKCTCQQKPHTLLQIKCIMNTYPQIRFSQCACGFLVAGNSEFVWQTCLKASSVFLNGDS
jgi:hypothetical protein